jgi:hypothetical protein
MISESEIFANNLIIRNFMSASPIPVGFTPHNLHYHDSYSCANKVIDKIRSLFHPIYGQTNFVWNEYPEMVYVTINTPTKTELICSSKKTEREFLNAYNECFLKFINWYEINKPCKQYEKPFTFLD